MAASKAKIERNLQRVRQDIAAACAKAHRAVEEVMLVAVTKAAAPEDIRSLVELGVTELAESRVPQLTERAVELATWLVRRKEPPPVVRWHMIGHLQRNKVKNVLEAARVVHSVDSLRLAEEISERGEKIGRPVDVLLQVNCSNEAQKFGCAIGAAPHLAEMISTMPAVHLCGLMTMAELSSDPEHSRAAFVLLREMFDELRHNHVGGDAFRHLSMGMSQDYVVAVEEGATMLRIGTALFE
jgi:PLP dependent protein